MSRRPRPKRRRALAHERLETRALLTASPWTNPLNPLDATGEGEVTSRDALVIINLLGIEQNQLDENVPPPILGGGRVAGRSSFHYDPTGDGQSTSLDALRIINAIDNPKANPPTQDDLPDQSSELGADASVVTFDNDYAIQKGQLSDATDRDVFRFEATQARASIDLSTIDDEELADVRILDDHFNEIARSSFRRGRSAFEGFEFETIPGDEYFVVVEPGPDANVENYFYAIEVYQYEPSKWAPRPDAAIGSDAHGETLEEARFVQFEDGFARISSLIDDRTDEDVFAIAVGTERIAFEAIGIDESGSFVPELMIMDSDGNQRQSIARFGGSVVVAGQPGEILYASVTARDGTIGQYVLEVNQFDAVTKEESLDDVDGDTLSEATVLNVTDEGLELFRRIDTADDVDVFQMQTPADGPNHVFLAVRGVGSTAEVDYQVIDSEGNVVDIDADSSTTWAADSDWVSLFNVAAGEDYFVRVSSPGVDLVEYSLTVGFVAGTVADQYNGRPSFDVDSPLGEDIHAASFNDATELSTVDGKLKKASHIDFADDEDVFKIPIATDYAIITVWGSGITFSVFDDQLNALDSLNNIEIDQVTAAATYELGDSDFLYVRVSGEGIADAYLLEIAELANVNKEEADRQVAKPDSPLGTDIHRDSFESATALAVENGKARVRSNIDTDSDADVFRVDVSGPQFSAEVLGNDVILEIYDEQQNLIAPIEAVEFDDGTVSGRYDLASDFVFARVFSTAQQPSEYQFSLVPRDENEQPSVPSDQPGDTLVDAVDLSIGNGTVIFKQTLDTPGDVDVYRIPNALPGSIGVLGLENISLDVFDDQGQFIARESNFSSVGSEFAFYNSVNAGFVISSTMYVRVASRSDAVGSYTFSLLFDGAHPAELPPDFSPFDPYDAFAEPDAPFGNDLHSGEIESATRLSYAESLLVSHIDSPGDRDVFLLRVYGENDLVMSAESADLESLQLVVMRPDGSTLEPDFSDGSNAFGFLSDTLRGDEANPPKNDQSPVELYVQVSAADDATGTYTLRQTPGLLGNGPENFGRLQPDADVAVRRALVHFPTLSEDIVGRDKHGGRENATTIELAATPVNVTSYIDARGDEDAFRFTAKYSDTLVTLYGANAFPEGTELELKLFDSEGNEVELTKPKGRLLYIAGRATLVPGEQYVAVVSSGDEAHQARYNLQVQPLGDIASLLDTDATIQLSLEESTANVNGELTDSTQVDVYRFSTNRAQFEVTVDGPERMRTQVIRAEGDGTAVTPVWGGLHSGLLLGGSDGSTHDYFLMVWNPDNPGAYELSLEVKGASGVPGEDAHGNTFEDAAPLPETNNRHAFTLELNSVDDVDVFRFDVQQETVTALIHAKRSDPLVTNQPDPPMPEVAMFDANLDPVASRVVEMHAGWSLVVFESIDPGQHFISFANQPPNPFGAFHVMIAEMTITDVDSHGRTFETASPLVVDSTREGASVTASIHPFLDLDTFQISIEPDDGEDFTGVLSLSLEHRQSDPDAASDPPPLLRLEIFNADGTRLLEKTGSNVSGELDVQNGDLLYARISLASFGKGDYTLNAKLISG